MYKRLVHRASGLAIAVSVSVLASSATAQTASPQGAPPPPAGHDAAVAEFRQARKLVEAGDCRQALPHLEESIAYEPSVGARLSIAECVEKTDPVRAWRAVADAALQAYTTNDDRLGVVEARLVELERLVPLLLIVISAEDLQRPGLEVSIDGKPLDRHHLSRGFGVAPGAHLVEVRSPAKARWSTTVTAPPAGSAIRVHVELAAQAAAAEVVSSPTIAAPPVVTVMGSDPRASRRAVGLALGATGVVAVAVGAVFGALALGKRDDLDTVCGGNRSSCAARPELVAPIRDNASALASVSTVSFIVGGVALASGLALYLWPGGAPATSAGRVRLAPAAFAMQGFSLEGAF